MRIVWISKASWKKPGPIAYMGLLNAFSFAWKEIHTDLFLHGPANTNINADLIDFYGLQPAPHLSIHLIPPAKSLQRPVYTAALTTIRHYCDSDEEVLVLTREVGILPALIQLKRRHPKLTVLHETHDYYGSVKHLPKRGLSDYRRLLSERLSLPKLDGLVCLTEYQQALYQQWLPALAVTAQPLGSARPSDKTSPHQAPPDIETRRNKRQIAYIGHLHSYKGLELIIQLAKRLQGQHLQVVCYGGHKQQVSELTARAETEQLSDVLKFVPFLTPKALNEVLATEISIGLAPLQNTYYNRYLTCPVKALDFMANGLPVVGSNVPCVKDLAGNAAITVAPNDINAYADAILQLLDNPSRYQLFSQAALHRANQLSWLNRSSNILTFVNTRNQQTNNIAPLSN